jgi:1-deoxyxylulose-5-phosphate synthase
MEYVTLGRTGVRVSRVCLGTAFRGQWDDSVCAGLVESALAVGVNFIDTANVYGEGRIGQAERVLGEVLRGQRDRVILTTKLFNPVGDGPNDRGLSRVHLVREIERSLARLQTDYVDVLFLHEPDPHTPLEETLRAVDAIVTAGKARYVGLSRFPAWQVAQALHIGERRNYAPVSVVQYRYNLVYREPELEVLPFVRDTGLGLMIFSPLAVGLLSGRFSRGKPPPADTPWAQGYTGFDRLMTPQTDDVVDKLQAIARDHDKTSAQVALAWILARPEVTAVIIGPDTRAQVEENVGAVGWRLTEEERRSLDELSAPVWSLRP